MLTPFGAFLVPFAFPWLWFEIISEGFNGQALSDSFLFLFSLHGGHSWIQGRGEGKKSSRAGLRV